MSKEGSKKFLFKKLRDSVYERKIYITIGSAEHAIPEINRRFGSDLKTEDFKGDDGGHFQIGDIDGGTVDVFVIWLDKLDMDAHDLSILTHEALHMTFQVMEYVGIPRTTESEEAYTYYAASIVKQAIGLVKNA